MRRKKQVTPGKVLFYFFVFLILGICAIIYGKVIHVGIGFFFLSFMCLYTFLVVGGYVQKYKEYALRKKDKKDYLKLKNDESNKIQPSKEIDYEKLRKQYSYLSLEAKNSIALIFEDIKRSFSSINGKHKNIDIYWTDVLIKMLNDVKDFETIEQIQILFSKNYFLKIIRENFGEILNYMEKYINVAKNKLGYQKYLEVLDMIASTVSENNYVKINTAMCQDIDELGIEESEFISNDVSAEIEYIGTVLVAHSTICQLVFVSKKIFELDEKDEFKQMIKKMIKEIEDHQIIFDKILPIYEEFYLEKLGNINKYLFNFAFYNMCFEHRDKAIEKTTKKMIDSEYINIGNLADINSVIKISINNLLDLNLKKHEVPFHIISIFSNIVDKNNFKLQLMALQKVYEWNDIYKEKLEKKNKELDRNRLLKGDFSKEKEAKSLKYNLLDVKTGNDFEVYLKNLLSALNYKVKLTAKSGDQGGDLIAKKGEITYVIQAKYYSKKLDNTPVQEVIGAIRFYNADRGVVITNNYFTEGAKNLAKANNILLINGDDLKKLSECVFSDSREDFLSQFYNKK